MEQKRNNRFDRFIMKQKRNRGTDFSTAVPLVKAAYHA